MNKKSRDTLRQIIAAYRQQQEKLKELEKTFDDLESRLERLESDERFSLDNTPENLQYSLAYDERADKADMLTDIYASAITVTSDCSDLIAKIQDLLDDSDDVLE